MSLTISQLLKCLKHMSNPDNQDYWCLEKVDLLEVQYAASVLESVGERDFPSVLQKNQALHLMINKIIQSLQESKAASAKACVLLGIPIGSLTPSPNPPSPPKHPVSIAVGINPPPGIAPPPPGQTRIFFKDREIQTRVDIEQEGDNNIQTNIVSF